MVGLRVQLGMRSLEKTPTYIEIFGRMILLRLSRNRWFDIPFTKAESLTADKKITITCKSLYNMIIILMWRNSSGSVPIKRRGGLGVR